MSESNHTISNHPLRLGDIANIIKSKKKLVLGESAKAKIIACRNYLDEKIKRHDAPIYGINTGFGSLCDTEISASELNTLQTNLVKSHACGMGAEVELEVIRLMLLLKVHALAQGHSGVQLATVERLIDFYNQDALPVIYEQGSLGASGDLAPLAHLALPLFGEGELHYQGQKISAADLLQKFAWEPIQLQSKEGLALLNGTQFMSSYAVYLLLKINHLSEWADFNASASLDAFNGILSPFDAAVHNLRPHPGQIQTALNVLKHLEGSEIAKLKKTAVQDPYCIRCVPQVHGASKDTFTYASHVVETEINSVTDNPTIVEEEDKIISAGNFHGQPLALILDYLAIATAELASISERRVYKLLHGKRELPAFLVDNPGLNSGFMIAQYSAASIVSQNKQLATPASVDTIDSSNGQEDHVSMGANAATKLNKVVDNLSSVLGIEWLTACQALDFRKEKSSPAIEAMKAKFRKKVAFVAEDVFMQPYMKGAKEFVEGNSIL